jgi:transposase
LRRLGWRWRRARRRTAKAPAPHRVTAARKALEKLRLLEAAGRCKLFYGDESGFCLQPTLFCCWQPPGPTLSLPAQAHGKRLNVAGFLRGDGSFFHFEREGRLGGAEFVEAVESKLLPVLSGGPAMLVLDNGPCHRSRLVKAKRAEWRARGLRLFFLPPYCPHLNRIETLWRMVKHRWLSPAAYATFSTLRQTIAAVLNQVGSTCHVTFA